VGALRGQAHKEVVGCGLKGIVWLGGVVRMLYMVMVSPTLAMAEDDAIGKRSGWEWGIRCGQ
jgi:hypothetical protein